MKLSKKQKERHVQYLRKIKIINELNQLIFGKVKTAKCTKCRKTIEVKKLLDCRNKWLDAMNSRKTIATSDSEFPFGTVQGIFQSTNPFVLCKECQYEVYRFMGKIPDLLSSRTFPQKLSEAVAVEDFVKELKSDKPAKYKIHYKKKKYPDTPKKYNELVAKSVKEYIKKYPYIKYSEKQLVRIIKNYKLQDRVTVF